MEDISDKKIREGGYTIEQGVEIIEGTPSENFVNFETPLLTKNDNCDIIEPVKKKRVQKSAIYDAKTPIGKLVKNTLSEVEERKRNRRNPKRTVILPQHRAVLNELQNNGGKISKAMIAMSYSKKFAEAQSMVLKESKSWQALMDENLPEDLIARRHMELLNKRARRDIKDKNGKIIEYGVDDGPDTQAVTKALEMAYKLRGAYTKDEAVKEANVTYNLFYKPGVQESVKAFEKQLIRQIYDNTDEDKGKIAEIVTDSSNETEGSIDDRGDQESADGIGEGKGGEE